MKVWPFKKKPIKLCKDCKWVESPIFVDRDFVECHHFKARYRDILGDQFYFCSTMRESLFSCGKRAKYFEPREEV